MTRYPAISRETLLCNKKTAMCTVTVLPAPDAIGVEDNDILLGVDEPGVFVQGVNLTPGTMCGYTYQSDNTEFVDVNAETGEIIARPHGLTPIPDQSLREIGGGELDQLRFDELGEKYP